MSNTHLFDVDVAIKYGVYEAILISNFQFWIRINIANERNSRDGRTWTYNSRKAFLVLFPYLTESKIKKALNNLIEDGVLTKGNYNKSAYDQTSWYAFNDEDEWLSKNVQCISVKRPMEEEETSNGVVGNVQSLNTDNKTYNKPDIKDNDYFEDVSETVKADFIAHRKNKKALITETSMKGIKREARKACISLENALIECCERGWVGFKADWYNKEVENKQQNNQKFDPVAYVNRNRIRGDDEHDNGIIDI